MAARLRSFLTFGLTDSVAALNERLLSIDAGVAELRAAGSAHATGDRLDQLQKEIGDLRALVIATDEHAQRKLKAGLASAVNLISVLPQLQIEGVLPPFPHRGFEVTGEFAVFLFHLVRRHRPKLIVELGCGSSSVLFAAAVRANGVGRVISIENDREHLRRTAQYLHQTELSDWVELIEAPLVEQNFGGRSLQWYDLAALRGRLSEKIDLLFIDGPPGKLQPLSRYPALPALYAHLSPQALVLVDDGRREDETRMVELWRELQMPFDTETLAFLPRAPYLLRMGGAEDRVTAFRPARNDGADGAAAERRTSFS
jgi:predicted O-methyltransferase YrrM